MDTSKYDIEKLCVNFHLLVFTLLCTYVHFNTHINNVMLFIALCES